MRSREKSRKEGKEGEGRGQKGRVEWTNATRKQEQSGRQQVIQS